MIPPIVIFAFNRPGSLKRLIDSLKKNHGFDVRDIYVFVDGPRNEYDQPKVSEVIDIASEITSNVIISQRNNGLGPSIIKGVSDIINQYGKVIVLEDDLVLMPGFISYMDKALDVYADDPRIFSICGYGPKIKRPKDYIGDVYLCNRSSSWGWATWKDRWNTVDWEVSDWDALKSSKERQKAFNKGGSDMFDMLKGYMEGCNKSWAIRFCYSQHKQDRYSVHPFRSLVANEGYGINATNCKQKYSRFKIDPSISQEPLMMPKTLTPCDYVIHQSVRYHGLPLRIYSKIRSILNI